MHLRMPSYCYVKSCWHPSVPQARSNLLLHKRYLTCIIILNYMMKYYGLTDTDTHTCRGERSLHLQTCAYDNVPDMLEVIPMDDISADSTCFFSNNKLFCKYIVK